MWKKRFKKKSISHKILYRIWPFWGIKSFWGRWLLIWGRNWKIKNDGSNDGWEYKLKILNLEKYDRILHKIYNINDPLWLKKKTEKNKK